MKNGSITTTLTPRNRGSGHVNMKKSVRPQSNFVCLVECWRCESLGVCFKRACSDADLYSQQLERAHEILRRRIPGLVNRNRVLLQQDNARLHTAGITMRKIQELGGIELLPLPANSPELVPSDYHLFRTMAHFLRGWNFEYFEAVEVSLTEFFA